MPDTSPLAAVQKKVLSCRRCKRLIRWCAAVAKRKVRRFAQERYWGRPVPGFGDARARLLVVGLAPAAHGANRTGRMFTGDRSGEWLYRALYRTGFCSHERSRRREDGLKLRDCWISAAVRCAPPGNKPVPCEIENCRRFLIGEIKCLPRLKVIVALGKVAFDELYKIERIFCRDIKRPRPRFGHGVQAAWGADKVLLASYHPSQQNTFTGKLNCEMFDGIFVRALKLLKSTGD